MVLCFPFATRCYGAFSAVQSHEACWSRTFNFQYTGWGKPKFSLTGGPGGNPAVLFDGTQQIGNGAGTVAVAQSMTYAMVVKASVFAANQPRLMASGVQILAPGANGFYESISAASRLESGDKSTEWTVILAVFDGPTSKIKSGPAQSSKAQPGYLSAGGIFWVGKDQRWPQLDWWVLTPLSGLTIGL